MRLFLGLLGTKTFLSLPRHNMYQILLNYLPYLLEIVEGRGKLARRFVKLFDRMVDIEHRFMQVNYDLLVPGPLTVSCRRVLLIQLLLRCPIIRSSSSSPLLLVLILRVISIL